MGWFFTAQLISQSYQTHGLPNLIQVACLRCGRCNSLFVALNAENAPRFAFLRFFALFSFGSLFKILRTLLNLITTYIGGQGLCCGRKENFRNFKQIPGDFSKLFWHSAFYLTANMDKQFKICRFNQGHCFRYDLHQPSLLRRLQLHPA